MDVSNFSAEFSGIRTSANYHAAQNDGQYRKEETKTCGQRVRAEEEKHDCDSMQETTVQSSPGRNVLRISASVAGVLRLEKSAVCGRLLCHQRFSGCKIFTCSASGNKQKLCLMDTQDFRNFPEQESKQIFWPKKQKKKKDSCTSAHRPQDFFCLQNPALDTPENIRSFKDLGLNAQIVSAAERLGVSRPTNIQVNYFKFISREARWYEAPSLNSWTYHVQFSVVCVDHKQQLIADRGERCTWQIQQLNEGASYCLRRVFLSAKANLCSFTRQGVDTLCCVPFAKWT